MLVSNSKLISNCPLVKWSILDLKIQFVEYEVTLGKAVVFGNSITFAHLAALPCFYCTLDCIFSITGRYRTCHPCATSSQNKLHDLFDLDNSWILLRYLNVFETFLSNIHLGKKYVQNQRAPIIFFFFLCVPKTFWKNYRSVMIFLKYYYCNTDTNFCFGILSAQIIL